MELVEVVVIRRVTLALGLSLSSISIRESEDCRVVEGLLIGIATPVVEALRERGRGRDDRADEDPRVEEEVAGGSGGIEPRPMERAMRKTTKLIMWFAVEVAAEPRENTNSTSKMANTSPERNTAAPAGGGVEVDALEEVEARR